MAHGQKLWEASLRRNLTQLLEDSKNVDDMIERVRISAGSNKSVDEDPGWAAQVQVLLFIPPTPLSVPQRCLTALKLNKAFVRFDRIGETSWRH